MGALAETFGLFTYAILFLIIFLETGLVITPFLPGDSLLFVLGAFSAQGTFNVLLLFILLVIAAILGDSVNYWIGNYFGEKVFANSRFFRQEHLERTKEFYRKHGGKAIVLGRFAPIIRTFVPFVAGVGKMNYSQFIYYNIMGGAFWVTLFLFSGYFFGNLPWVKHNFEYLIIAIILISVVPMFIEWWKAKNHQESK